MMFPYTKKIPRKYQEKTAVLFVIGSPLHLEKGPAMRALRGEARPSQPLAVTG
jgi:hypothetical protein